MKIIKKIFLGIFLILIISIIYLVIDAQISPPVITDTSALNEQRVEESNNFYKIKNNWLRKSTNGIWEMYVEGSPFEMGVYEGKLSKELMKIQEDAFVEQISILIPSKSYQKFLRYFIGIFNRDIDEYIPQEYQEEIYGMSKSTSDEFDYIAPNYQRMLNYHGAHDIGHALKDLAMVGCTSFGVNMNNNDSNMLIGRNFDFYVNDDFAKNKLICFAKPDSGYKFMYYTWASFIGVVSGMNEKGLTVTINAAQSDIPTKAAMPISILARQILQYAQNIDEAKALAEKADIFVSESILIGSAQDDNVVIIEKSPTKQGFYSTSKSSIVCPNHFQSTTFANNENNIENIKESASNYRFKRCWQLINNYDNINYIQAAEILRDTKGIDDENIGIGNEKAMNQLISHHSIIFKPKELKVWVSTPPYQLGKYIMYDLNKIFNLKNITAKTEINDTSFTIPVDSFLYSNDYKNRLKFVEIRHKIWLSLWNNEPIENADNIMKEIVESNPEYYLSYYEAGDYYFHFKQYKKAKENYDICLTKLFENEGQRRHVLENLKKINELDF